MKKFDIIDSTQFFPKMLIGRSMEKLLARLPWSLEHWIEGPAYVITPRKLEGLLNIKEIWKYRGVFYSFAHRDFKLRYRQTLLGFGWVIIQPLLSVGVFSLLFHKLVKIPSEGIPYPLFIYSALLPWTLFCNCITRASTSLAGNFQLLTKAFFPRILIPSSSLITPMIDFFIGFCFLLLTLIAYGFPISGKLMAIPFLTFLTMLFALGVSLWLSAIHVCIRDLGNILHLTLQLWMFCTPVLYPANLIAEKHRVLYYLNPMVGIISGFRSAIVGTNFDFSALTVSMAFTMALLITGVYFFRYAECVLADVV
ncbi:MAG: ABC transporter permease [Deltaproteobacteria bacterium]|nr:ABC transporter permease [Deltaproteobacteria bacterium]